MNKIYCFSGTGNSLYVAKIVAESLDNCEITAIKKDIPIDLSGQYERIGFVFPVYFWGLPVMVADFMQKVNLAGQSEAYFFAIATHGGFPGNGIPQVGSILADKGLKLNYGMAINMIGNAITYYNLSAKADSKIAKSEVRILESANEILQKKVTKIKPPNRIVQPIYKKGIAKLRFIAAYFNVGDTCTKCGICASLCPAKNIALISGKPAFGSKCESCVACIQLCPQKAINYKGKTHNRKRYKHPKVQLEEIMELYKS